MTYKNFVYFGLAGLILSACSEASAPKNEGGTQAPTELNQSIKSADGSTLGNLKLTDLGAEGTKVTVTVAGISPGVHAMHFHEIGACVAPDFKSSGGHYNPAGVSHGTKMADGPHAGDMMNVTVSEDGSGEFTVINEQVSINGDHGLHPLLDSDGTALVLHAKADDYESQPSGAAGARIGCAVIGQ